MSDRDYKLEEEIFEMEQQLDIPFKDRFYKTIGISKDDIEENDIEYDIENGLGKSK